MLIIVGCILSIAASILTYWGFGFFNESLWYLFVLIPMFITYFVLYLNVYWGIILICIAPYKKKEFPGKVNKFHLTTLRLLSSFCLTLRGIIVKKKGFELMPKQASLILFNHISDYDPWVMYKIMRGRYAFVGKRGLRKIPVVRCLASSAGTLYVENNNPELNRQMVEHAIDYIANKDTSVAIAPEGTRNFTGELREFKHGGFHIAINAKCPIVLVGFTNMEKTVTKKNTKLVKVNVELFDIIQYDEYKDKSAGEIANMCRERYLKYLGQDK